MPIYIKYNDILHRNINVLERATKQEQKKRKLFTIILQ